MRPGPQVWGLNSTTPHFTLEGHDRGVNCINYFPGGEKPFLVSGADDQLIKVWDYQTKTCVATLEGHTNNVSAVAFHPHLPLIITGSEVCLAGISLLGLVRRLVCHGGFFSLRSLVSRCVFVYST
jgi:WD40 repeat protein